MTGAQRCAADRFPQAALDAMVRMSARPVHDDGHTDCYYAGLLIAALPHLVTDEMVERGAAAIHSGHGCTCRLGAKGDARAVLVAALAPCGDSTNPTSTPDPKVDA
jgi:hypothetical protein